MKPIGVIAVVIVLSVSVFALPYAPKQPRPCDVVPTFVTVLLDLLGVSTPLNQCSQ
jgi:hypothetical protein